MNQYLCTTLTRLCCGRWPSVRPWRAASHRWRAPRASSGRRRCHSSAARWKVATTKSNKSKEIEEVARKSIGLSIEKAKSIEEHIPNLISPSSSNHGIFPNYECGLFGRDWRCEKQFHYQVSSNSYQAFKRNGRCCIAFQGQILSELTWWRG